MVCHVRAARPRPLLAAAAKIVVVDVGAIYDSAYSMYVYTYGNAS